jgi:MFS family permease
MQALSLLLTFGVSGLVGPVAGALGDRFDRRTVLIWSEATAALFFVAMVFVDAPVALIALAFGSAIAEQPFFSASRAAIPVLIERDEDLSWANSLITMGVHTGIAVGPVIGGVLVALAGPSWVFGINAASFVASLLVTLTIRAPFQEERTQAQHEEHRGMLAGLRYLVREPVLRRLAVAWVVFVLGMGMGMVADAPLAAQFDAGGFGFGLLIACWGTGSVAGTFVGRWMSARTEPIWMVAGAAGITVTAFGVGLVPWFWLVLACLLAMGICDGLTIVAENSIVQRRTPDAVRSRTMAAFESTLSLGLAVAFVAAGPVLDAVGPQPVYRIGGAFALGSTLVLLPLLRLRRMPQPDAAAEPDVEEVEHAFKPDLVS